MLTDQVVVQARGPAELAAAPSAGAAAAPDAHVAEAERTARAWLAVLRDGLAHRPYLLEATAGGQCVGVLPLALVQSALFGRFLVSLPYVNAAGVAAESHQVAQPLVDRAVALADELNVRYLELRHQEELAHPALTQKNDTKVLMRLTLPATAEALMAGFKSKLRSQIRAGQKHDFEVRFGGLDCLDDFYRVFCHNMRDLGTPVFSRRLFAAILKHLPEAAELCVLRLAGQPVAAALLVHGCGATEVPSASSLKAYNATSANMVMYWHLLARAVERGQRVFDFGRSTLDSNTYKFKKQWGAESSPSIWQYYVRRGTIGDMRPDNARFGLAVKVWRRLPLWLANLAGPPIVRGIP